MNLLGTLSAGYSIKQVLNYLVKNFPELKERVQEALRAGKSPEEIMKYLSSFDGKKISSALNSSAKAGAIGLGVQAVSKSLMKQPQPKGALFLNEPTENPYIQGKQAVKEYNPIPETVKTGIKAGATALGGYALSRALPTIAQQLAPGLLRQPVSPAPSERMPGQTPNQPQANAAPSIPSSTNVISQIPAMQAQIEKLRQLGSGNDATSISAYFKKFNPKDVKTLEKATGQPIEKLINEYIAQNPVQTEQQATSTSIPQPELPQQKVTPVTPETPSVEPMTVGSLALLPKGEVGEIESVKNGIAKVNVNGEMKHRKLSELESVPFTEEEIANAYDNLMSKIPEEHRSGFASWFGYDEARNVIGFIPRGGNYEELENPTPEELEKIKHGTGLARTTGENIEGVWVAGEKTKAGVISQIIHDRRKKREAAEKQQLKFPFAEELPKSEKESSGMKTLFDELAYARNLSREREKKIREAIRAKAKEEREKKKNEKKQSKKRKKQT